MIITYSVASVINTEKMEKNRWRHLGGGGARERERGEREEEKRGRNERERER